jgi:hypothetical protein
MDYLRFTFWRLLKVKSNACATREWRAPVFPVGAARSQAQMNFQSNRHTEQCEDPQSRDPVTADFRESHSGAMREPSRIVRVTEHCI